MANQFGHGKIVTNGLVYAVDTSDSTSYIGEPTTNIMPSPTTMSTFGSYGNAYTETFTTEFGTTGYRMVNRIAWNGVLANFNVPAAGTYTLSAYIRFWNATAGCGPGAVYTVGPGVPDTATIADPNIVGTWQRVSLTVTYNAAAVATIFLISWGGDQTGAYHSTWDVTMPQIELNRHATRFVDGSRVATAGLKNLVADNNHADLTNMLYNANSELLFDGSSTFIAFPSSTVFDTAAVTVETWCKPDGLAQNGFFFEKGVVNTQYSLFLESGNMCWRTGASLYANTSYLTNNTWNHICGTFISGSKYLYVNGQPIASDTVTYTMPTNQGSQTIGCYNGGGYRYNGQIGVIRVYNRVLSAAEVLHNYNTHKTRYGLV